MNESLKKIQYLVISQKKEINFLVFLFLILSLLEVIGLGLIAPYIAIIVNESVANNFLVEIASFIGVSKDRNSMLFILGFGLLLVFMVKTFVMIYVNKKVIFFSQNYRADLTSFLMKSYQSLSYTDYLQRNSSEYIYNAQTLASQFSSLLLLLLRALSGMIISIFIIVLLAWQDISVLFILTMLIGLTIFSFDLFFKNKVTEYGKKSNQTSVSMLKNIYEGMSGFKDIRIFGKELYFYEKVRREAKLHSIYSTKSQIISIIPHHLLELLLIVFIVALVNGTLFFEGNLKELVPTLGMFGIAALKLLPSANTFTNALTQLRQSKDSVSRLYNDVQYTKKRKLVKLYKPKTFEFLPFQSFELLKVSFRYPGTNQDTLKEISLNVNSGDSIGIIGPSGSGKSTLVDLILGLLEPSKGEIQYNNKKPTSFMDEWHHQVAYLPQSVFLIDDSLKCNIALGDDLIDIDRLNKAIHQSRLSNLVKSLPSGIDTVIGERGIRLSGGQRQRIALARAFYHDRNVLIMDEATSALDNETEKEIVKEIKNLKGRKTVIVIAHRLSTIEHCDCIYKLKDGHIIEKGTYQEIIS